MISSDDAIRLTGDKDRALLIGNGISIKYFRYKTLLEKADLKKGDPVRLLFTAFDTVDFESVIRALEEAPIVERALAGKR